MKTTFSFIAWVVALAGSVTAAPVTFNEISLLVRMRDTDAYMTQQLTQRRLLHALTPGQEEALKAQGASDALLQALRKPDVVYSAEEAAAFEAWSEQQRLAIEKRNAEDAAHRDAVLAKHAALAAQQLEGVRVRADAVAAAYHVPTYDYEYAPYYGGYSGGYYGGGIGGIGCVDGRGSFSATALRWQNGTSTVYTKPGLYYHPFGTNGSVPNPSQTGSVSAHRGGNIIGASIGGKGGGGSSGRGGISGGRFGK